MRSYPRWVYEAIPTIYIVVGFIILTSGAVNLLEFISGCLFACAGVCVYHMRLRYRQQQLDALRYSPTRKL